MRVDSKAMRLYAVTDRSWLRGQTLYQQVEEALQGGVTFLQLREKNMAEEDFLQEAIEIKKLCKKYQVPLIINDSVKVALACDADGVHVGQSDMEAADVRGLMGPNKIIGVSARTVEQAVKAYEHGADYLGVGACFSTSTKLDANDVDWNEMKKICQTVDIPIVAIGGITKENVMQLQGTGVDGVAVVSAIFAQEDICAASKELRDLSEKMVMGTDMKKVLTIAGSDCSGGAGIQADIKTIAAHGMYAMSAITALTAQNTLGVTGILEATPEFVGQELDAIFTDIRPDAVKIGMVSNSQIISVIVDKLKEYEATNIVVDPVMVSTSGSKLLCDEASDALIHQLLPLGTVITPNIPEAEVLCGFAIDSKEKMIEAARVISANVQGGVLVKGGHFAEDADDLLYIEETPHWFASERIDNPNTHGTGCTLSSAIACGLAGGLQLPEAIAGAKEYITGALRAQMNLGHGSGPLNHMYQLSK